VNLGFISDRSQEGRLLRLLQSRGKQWTSAVELSEISLQYCARIAGLRKRGVVIENKLETSDDGRRRGFYRLQQVQSDLFADGVGQ
jgi:hypothetical protein